MTIMKIPEHCLCVGAGVLEKDGKIYDCPCAKFRRRRSSMPAEIRNSFFSYEHMRIPMPDSKRPICQSVERSLRLHFVSTKDMNAMIKVTMAKNPELFIKITSDREILDVYLGKASRNARGNDEADDIYNSIQDLVNGASLQIVRLNEIGYKNKAAPGALLEALQFRLDRDKPVWIVTSAERSFAENSFSWSDNIREIINNTMTYYNVPMIHNPDFETSNFSLEHVSTPVAISNVTVPVKSKPVVPKFTEEPVEKPKTKSKFIQSTPDEVDVSPKPLYGGGIQKSKKNNWGRS